MRILTTWEPLWPSYDCFSIARERATRIPAMIPSTRPSSIRACYTFAFCSSRTEAERARGWEKVKPHYWGLYLGAASVRLPKGVLNLLLQLGEVAWHGGRMSHKMIGSKYSTSRSFLG